LVEIQLVQRIINVMTGKKITIKQIAKEAGVSTATVSYVLNDRKDQKISDAAKKKILQIANLYHYSVNPAAKSLVTGHCNSVAVYIQSSDSLLRLADAFIIISRLSEAFHAAGINVVLTPDTDTSQAQNVDGIICVGTKKELFRKIANNNFVPVIAIDTIIRDPLFHEIIDDYSLFSGKTMLTLPLSSESYEQYLSGHFHLVTINKAGDIDRYFQENQGQDTYIRNNSVKNYCSEKGYHPILLDSWTQEKTNRIVDFFKDITADKADIPNQIKL